MTLEHSTRVWSFLVPNEHQTQVSLPRRGARSITLELFRAPLTISPSERAEVSKVQLACTHYDFFRLSLSPQSRAGAGQQGRLRWPIWMKRIDDLVQCTFINSRLPVRSFLTVSDRSCSLSVSKGKSAKARGTRCPSSFSKVRSWELAMRPASAGAKFQYKIATAQSCDTACRQARYRCSRSGSPSDRCGASCQGDEGISEAGSSSSAAVGAVRR